MNILLSTRSFSKALTPTCNLWSLFFLTPHLHSFPIFHFPIFFKSLSVVCFQSACYSRLNNICIRHCKPFYAVLLFFSGIVFRRPEILFSFFSYLLVVTYCTGLEKLIPSKKGNGGEHVTPVSLLRYIVNY